MRRLLGILFLLPLFAWAQSPFDGTWRFDPTTAKFAQKPETLILQNGEYTCTTCIPKIDVKADGSDQRVPGAKDYDTIAVKQMDFKSVQYTRKKDGKVVSESTDSVSPDGRTQTMAFKNYPPQGKPVTGRVIWTRVSPAPAGAHAISGSWRIQKVEGVSEHGLSFTYKSTAGGLSMTAPTGESYDAKFDGKDYPVKKDRAGGTVSLKKIDDNTIEETYKQDGKPVAINRMGVKGRMMTITVTDPRRGTTEVYMAQKM